MRILKNIFSAALHLFYPHCCTACGSDLIERNNLLCLKCLEDLPHTHFAGHENNPAEKMFWGRLALANAYSEFYFTKGSAIQTLIHQLKYKSNKEIGYFLGKMMGKSILESNRFQNIHYLIPVPLFPDKEFKRGYNQATILCIGISSVLNIPVRTDLVSRIRYTETQTKKKIRTERWENVAGSFVVKNRREIKGKHLLLVDDVLTTGATMEACSRIILQQEETKLSIATLAIATK
jgi:ComF family protein